MNSDLKINDVVVFVPENSLRPVNEYNPINTYGRVHKDAVEWFVVSWSNGECNGYRKEDNDLRKVGRMK